MKKLFKTEEGQVVGDPISYTLKILREHKDVKIYVGTDSQNKKYNTTYVTCIAYKYGTRGAHFIYFRENIKKIRDRRVRLWGEVERSIEISQFIEENNLKVECVEFDFNEKEMARSHDMVAAACGYAEGLGFKSNVKPETQCAVRASDHMCKR